MGHNNIRFTTPLLRSDLCDYSEVHIVVKGTITVEGTNDANKRNKTLVLLHLDHAYQKSIGH